LAVVHEGYDGASSFFRRGLLELFSIFSGRKEFLDYRDHDACVREAVRFVEGQYYRTMDELSDEQRLAARHRGTVFEHALERSPNRFRHSWVGAVTATDASSAGVSGIARHSLRTFAQQAAIAKRPDS